MRRTTRVSRRLVQSFLVQSFAPPDTGSDPDCRGTQTVMPAQAGHPVRRDLSFPSLPSLEYWIVRPSAQLRTRRTMTPNMHPRSRGAERARGVDRSSRPNEGAGKTGCALHPRSRVQWHKEVRTRAYRSSGEHPAFPAQWFDGLWRALPGDEFLLPPSSAN